MTEVSHLGPASRRTHAPRNGYGALYDAGTGR
jgi:hypothetical protein